MSKKRRVLDSNMCLVLGKMVFHSFPMVTDRHIRLTAMRKKVEMCNRFRACSKEKHNLLREMDMHSLFQVLGKNNCW